jgi:hypothetical protein
MIKSKAPTAKRSILAAVPISILLVPAPIAASSGNGELSWRAK